MFYFLTKFLPPAQPRDLGALAALVRGKSIALVGNAASLYAEFRDIDRHDVVVRMNGGLAAHDPEGRAGNRTDILLISGLKFTKYMDVVPHVVWMTPIHRDRLARRKVNRLYFYPVEWWEDLSAEVGARPSTGCMGIDLMSRIIGTGEIHLYGFDFWRSPTSYTGRIRPRRHSPSAEEAFARKRLGQGPLYG